MNKTSKKLTIRELLKVTLIVIGLLLMWTLPFIPASEYADVPVLWEQSKYGREKNALAAVVSGILAQKLYDSSSINLTIEKHFFVDSKITGYTTNDSIYTRIKLLFDETTFKGFINDSNKLEGNVDKHEFDWHVIETSKDTYKIDRFFLKFNSELKISIDEKNKTIVGEFIRSGLRKDWKIEGSYKDTGEISLEVDGSWNLGITLEGKITLPKDL